MIDIAITPIVVPPTIQKTYDKGYIKTISIFSAGPNTPVKFHYEINPYNGTDILGTTINRTITDLKVVSQTNPQLAMAYQAILNAITEHEALLASLP